MFSVSNERLIIVGIVAVVTFTIVGVINFALKIALQRRKSAIEKLKDFEAVETSTPVERPLKAFKRQARKGVTVRFSIFRRVVVFSAVCIVIVAAIFPFVDQLPKAIISIIVASAAVITGMAARPFIENFLSGIAITGSRMLNIGDTILINDKYGTIEDISPTHTVVKLWDWRRFVIPNSSMINQEFINYTLTDSRIFAYIEFSVSYDADLERVEALAVEAVLESQHYRDDEDPAFWIMDTEKDAVRCWLASWATSPQEAWELRADMRTNIVKKLRNNGIKTHLQQVEFINNGGFTVENSGRRKKSAAPLRGGTNQTKDR